MLKIAEWSVKEWQASKSTTGWDEEDQVPHRQIFQLQQSYCVVRFHILWDQSKSEVCVLKNSLPLLSLRPVLSTLYLHVHTLLHYNHTTQASHIHNTCTHFICTLEAFQAKRVCLYRCDRYGTVWYKDGVRFSHRAFLYNTIQHHDPSAALLPHHLPEVATGVW